MRGDGGMDKRTPNEIEEIVNHFLYQMPKHSQTEAAKRLGIRKQDFNNYYNHRYKPPEELLLEMERFLHARGIYLSHDKGTQRNEDSVKLTILERAEKAKNFMKTSKKLKDQALIEANVKKNIHCKNFCNVKKKRWDQEVAEKFSLGNATTLRQSLKIIAEGSFELKQAINTKRLRVDEAYQLLKLPSDEQRILLQENESAMDAYFEKEKKEKAIKKIRHLIEKSAVLMDAESKVQSPLREKLIEEIVTTLCATKLALLSTALQNDVLSKEEKNMADYFAPKKESDETSITKLLKIAKKHPGFMKVQQATALSLEAIFKDILVEGRLLLK